MSDDVVFTQHPTMPGYYVADRPCTGCCGTVIVAPTDKVRRLLDGGWVHDTSRKCACFAWPGTLHREGCSVEHCTTCGGQRIACGHLSTVRAPWTGLTPKVEAQVRYQVHDLNKIHPIQGWTWNRKDQAWEPPTSRR